MKMLLVNIDEYLKGVEKEANVRLLFEQSKARSKGKQECREMLKRTFESLRALLTSESRTLAEKQRELATHLQDKRDQLTGMEKHCAALRDQELQALSKLKRGENELAELKFLQSKLQQHEHSESETMEKQEVSVLLDSSSADSGNSSSDNHDNFGEIAVQQLEDEMLSSARAHIAVIPKFSLDKKG
jgi:hypothetical protein